MFLNSTILIIINCTSGVLRCYIQWFSEMSGTWSARSVKLLGLQGMGMNMP
jgi:hypothetical protein